MDLAVAYSGIGYAESGMGNASDAEAHLLKASDIAGKAVLRNPASTDLKDLLCYTNVLLGEHQERGRMYASALDSYRRALNVWTQRAAASPADFETVLRIASTEEKIGKTLGEIGPLR